MVFSVFDLWRNKHEENMEGSGNTLFAMHYDFNGAVAYPFGMAGSSCFIYFYRFYSVAVVY